MPNQSYLKFENSDVPTNLLPFDGEVYYHGAIYDPEKADAMFRYLLEDIPWKHDEVFLFGKHITTARKVAWFGDEDYSYAYSGKSRTAIPWTPELLEIKNLTEDRSGVIYNSCLLNLYAEGTQGMGWHSDDEACLGNQPNIASLSFGAERRFDFRHKSSQQKLSIILQHGSLLVMQGETQHHWQHQIPKTKKVTQPRINLTFRTMHY